MMDTARVFHVGALASLVILIGWLVAWEAVVAPLAPGSWLLALKALPLLLPLRGVIQRDLYTLQWSSMFILVYFVEGVVRAWVADTLPLTVMSIGEIVLVTIYFTCALMYLYPYKREARRLAKELLDKVKVPHD